MSSRLRTAGPVSAIVLAGVLLGFAGFSPADEEEEPQPKPPVRKVEVPEDEPSPAAADGASGSATATKLDDIARAEAAATHPEVKAFLGTFAVAFDKLGEGNRAMVRITPVPLVWGKDRFPAEFGVADLDSQNKAAEARSVTARQVRTIQPFEQIAVDAVEQFLKPVPPPVPPDAAKAADKLAAAERVLTAVLFFHESAREKNARRGKNWEPLKASVYDKLTEVRVARVRQAAADKDWAKLKELSTRLLQLYKSNPKVLEAVLAARLAEAEQLVQSDKVTDLERGRNLLGDYESRFPNANNESAKRVRAELAKRAKQFLDDATRKLGTDDGGARNLLKTVEAIDPDNPALRGMQQQLKAGYSVLVVAARQLPERMSPATARFDSEKQAAELMFEGLSEALPDPLDGVRFHPALAADRSIVGAGVRDIPLLSSAEWAGPDRAPFDGSDVSATLRLYRQHPESWAAEPTFWLDEPGFDPADPTRIRMRLKVGHPDPRPLLTMKIYPARWLLEKNKSVDDLEFARKPFGTGPYKLDPKFKPRGANEPAKDVVFVANPAYSRRPGHGSQPAIKEIRFTDANAVPDLPTEFRAERMHVLTDVPTAELPRYTANNNLGGKVRVVTAATNRRVYFLAFNHRRPGLQNPDARRGILHAIDRDKILNEVYRAGIEDAHKPLNGPFPAGCWASPAGAPLYKPDVAQARLRQYTGSPQAMGAVNLLFPDNDPLARAACERMKIMIESATATDDRKLTVNLAPVPPRELLRRVEEVHDYDLAYVPFDYPDDWYPLALGSFLDPAAAGGHGRNFPGYLSRGTTGNDDDERLARLLADARRHRDFDRLRTISHEIHRRFIDAAPLVPLWQLDRHTVLSTAVKIYFDGQTDEVNPRYLNPTTLFSSVGRWVVE